MCTACLDPKDAKNFILAGNATVTLVSKKTQQRYTFKVQKSKETKNNAPIVWFVKTLYGSDNTKDYAYLGMIKNNSFQLTKMSKYNTTSPQFVAFSFVWGGLAQDKLSPMVEIWHEGKCGRCGRKLTVPSSIASGIGPECAKFL